MFRPTEMSMPPRIRTYVIPTAAMPSGEACWRMRRKLSTVRNLGLPLAKNTTVARKMT